MGKADRRVQPHSSLGIKCGKSRKRQGQGKDPHLSVYLWNSCKKNAASEVPWWRWARRAQRGLLGSWKTRSWPWWFSSVQSLSRSVVSDSLWSHRLQHARPPPIHHQRPESTQTQVHWVGDAIQPSHPLPHLLMVVTVNEGVLVYQPLRVVGRGSPKLWHLPVSMV